MELNGQHHAPAALAPEKNPSTCEIEGWMDTRAGIDVVEKK
jgi:hypothetical protein